MILSTLSHLPLLENLDIGWVIIGSGAWWVWNFGVLGNQRVRR